MVNTALDSRQKCANCHLPHSDEALYCLGCGFILPHAFKGGSNHTLNLPQAAEMGANLQWGTGYFHHRARLFLQLSECDQLIPVPLTFPVAILGRRADNSAVDVDLTPFEGAALGVSRRHARIERGRDVLWITDLDSANGTFLNRERLVPDKPHIIRNRAVLQLGRLVLRIQFT
jgi:hypothetical protein